MIGGIASKSSFIISAARFDMFLKIFSRSVSSAPLRAFCKTSCGTSRSNFWMP
ncbi:Uncharacterised protein [Vibrio cholerae]|nr:Uncharacterised protein [Vibrio cholerae]